MQSMFAQVEHTGVIVTHQHSGRMWKQPVHTGGGRRQRALHESRIEARKVDVHKDIVLITHLNVCYLWII